LRFTVQVFIDILDFLSFIQYALLLIRAIVVFDQCPMHIFASLLGRCTIRVLIDTKPLQSLLERIGGWWVS